MFNARLQVAFRGVPGEDQVRQERYRVLTHDQQIIDPRCWTDLVSPRSKLRMAVYTFKEIMDDKVCPQPASMTNSRVNCFEDLVLELLRLAPRGEYKEDMERSWRMEDGREDYLWSRDYLIEARYFGGWDQDLIGVRIGRKVVDIVSGDNRIQRRWRQS